MSDDDGSLTGLLVGVAGFLGVILIGGVLYFAAIKPASDKLDKSTARLENKEKDLGWQTTGVEELEDSEDNLKRDVARLKQKVMRANLDRGGGAKSNDALGRLRKRLAGSTDTARLLETLSGYADRTRVALKTVEPQKTSRQGPLTRVPLKLAVTGRYADLGAFTTRLATHQGRVLVPSQVALEPTRAIDSPLAVLEEPPRLLLTMVLTDHTLGDDQGGTVKKVVNPPVKNRPWKTLRQHFWAFGIAGLENKRDPFEPTLHRFVEARERPETETPDAGPAPPDVADTREPPSLGQLLAEPDAGPPPDPRTAHPTASYQVMSTFERGGQWTAVVIGPDKKTHTVQVDAKLGNASGVVIEITAQSVTVDEPAADEGIVLENLE